MALHLSHDFVPYVIAATVFKVLLFPAYKSTDFEVHRNWLALTHSLPVSQWYYEKTSEWTLDYPPFFAYFEYGLSLAARLVDPAMLQVSNLEYSSWQTVYFQRTTVILTELLLVFALYLFVSDYSPTTRPRAVAVALSIYLSPGLLIIDHIHFQYNGFMYGILVLSLALARRESSMLLCALSFAALLCFKHIYLYLAPAYFAYLFRGYCLGTGSLFSVRWLKSISLGVIVVAVFGAAFGPFAAWGQMPQVLGRLFPFSRGLNHAYWAPNAWSLYSLADRLLILAAPYFKLSVNREAVNSVTRGLVGDTAFAILPDVTPRVCFLLTLATQLVSLVKVFLDPTWPTFVRAVTLCGYASFLFGWHVHEKAILLVIIPFSLIALNDRRHLAVFRPLAVAGYVSLFPLLFGTAEFPIKLMYTLAWVLVFFLVFDRLCPATSSSRFFLLDRLSFVYAVGFIPLLLYSSCLHDAIIGQRLEFLPLVLISSYSALGVLGSWLAFVFVHFTS